MKKHNEGYALALVLVVLTVLCLVALSMMSAALANINRQQATLLRMEEKYEAQGQIEIVMGRLEKDLQVSRIMDTIPISQEMVETACNGTDVHITENLTRSGDKLIFTLTTVVPGSKTQIICDIRICGQTITKHQEGEEFIYYDVKIPSIEYDSYSIIYNADNTPKGGGEG